MMKSGFLNKLKQFGLNSYQAKLWMALLSRGVATAGELSDISNVPRSRAYDVLETLEKKGFIMMKVGKPIKYIAVPPAEVLRRVKAKIKEEADKEASQIEKLIDSDILGELSSLHSNGINKVEPNDMIASVKGRKNINYHLSRMFADAQSNITIVTTADGMQRKADCLKRHAKQLKEKKVNVRIACPLTTQTQRIARDLKSLAEVREIAVKSRFVIVDETKMVFMLEDDAKTNARYDTGVNVESPFFTENMRKLFEFQWNNLPRIN